MMRPVDDIYHLLSLSASVIVTTKQTLPPRDSLLMHSIMLKLLSMFILSCKSWQKHISSDQSVFLWTTTLF